MSVGAIILLQDVVDRSFFTLPEEFYFSSNQLPPPRLCHCRNRQGGLVYDVPEYKARVHTRDALDAREVPEKQ